MKSYPISGLTLVGYYGFNNLGDDLLLLSSLLLIKESGFGGPVFIPTRYSFDKILDRFPDGMNIEPIRRYNPFELLAAVKASRLTLFGGGNLFQDETSSRSFLYYHWLARSTIENFKDFVMLSQGFGPINRKSNNRRLKDILLSPRTMGFTRDLHSHDYFSRFSDRCYFGTDFGPYYLLKNGLIPSEVKRVKGLAVVVPKDGIDPENIVISLKSRGFTSMCSIGFNNHHDEVRRLALEVCAQKNNFKILPPPSLLEDIVALFASAELVLSERLHGLILAMALGTPFGWKAGEKIDNFVASLDVNCKLSYSNDIESIVRSISRAEEFDFRKLSREYLSRLAETVEGSRRLLSELTDKR